MNDKRRCTAHTSNGSRRCKKAAMLGQRVCRSHGGASPQAKRSARERLNALVEPAIEALSAALKSGDTNSIIRTAQIVLDRSGYGPGSKVELRDTTPPGESSRWGRWCTPSELKIVLEIADRATARMDAGEPERGVARLESRS